jgi:plastocyanin
MRWQLKINSSHGNREYSNYQLEQFHTSKITMKTLLLTATTLLATTAFIAPHPFATASTGKATKVATSKKTKAPVARQVSIDNFSFNPATLIVTAGTTVTWVNHDDMPHTIKTVNQGFSSPALDTDQRYSYRFTKRGTYAYFCSIHPMMKAKVIVK